MSVQADVRILYKMYYERVKNETFIKHDLIYNGFSFLLVC